MIDLTIPGVPVPKGRPRFGGGRAYTPKKTAVAERSFSFRVREALASSHHLFPLAGPLVLRCVFTFPATRGKILGDFHTQKPDLDNCAKLVLDSLNGFVFVDDAQVASLTVEKRWGLEGSTRLVVEMAANKGGAV